MPFEQIADKNAQRAEQGAVSVLQVQGQHSNQTLEGMGAQDVTSATRTAAALGELAIDLVGNANAIRNKEAYVEAYANAGAGRSVKELRDEQPAWETLFGPSATVQGAQARTLQTAVANLGNEGLAMVESNKDKDPATFHKMLASTVGKHLTGDSATDTLITQKSIELTTEIAAAHYKANAKYVQELNVQAYTDSVTATVNTYKTMQKLDPTLRSPEGDAKALQAVKDALAKPVGMDAISHQKKNVEILANDLASGSLFLRSLLMPSLHPSTHETAVIAEGDAKYAAIQAKVKAGLMSEQEAKLAMGEKPAPLDIPLDAEDRHKLHLATKKGEALINEQRSTTVATSLVNLGDYGESGKSQLQVLSAIASEEKRLGINFTLGEKMSILNRHAKKEGDGANLLKKLNNYKAYNKDPEGEAIWHAQLRANLPKWDGEMAVLRDIVNRNQPGGNEPLKYEFSSHLSRPLLADGTKNPKFDEAFLKFQAMYKMDKEIALSHIDKPEVQAQFRDGMRALDANTETPETLAKAWSSVKPTSAADLKASVSESDLKAVLRGTSNNQRYNVMGLFGKPTAMTNYMETTILQTAARVKQNNPALTDLACVEAAADQYKKTHESINGVSQPISGESFTARMKLADPKATADDALDHWKKKNKFEHVRTVQRGNVMEIHRTNKHGIDLPGEPTFISYKELGDIHNREVTAPKEALHRKIQGKSNDAALEGRIESLDYRYRKMSKQYTREELVDLDRKEQEASSKVITEAKDNTAKFVKQVLKEPGIIAGKVGGVFKDIKKFINTHELGLPDRTPKPTAKKSYL